MNAVLLAGICWAIITYILTGPTHEDSRDIVLAAVLLAELIILGIALYFFIRNKEVQIWVSPSEFHYSDPVFGDYGFTASVNDITALRQIRSATNQYAEHIVEFKTGESKRIMYQNYSIDRQKLFDALQKANPSIIVPDGPWEYEITRPQWAHKVREKLNIDD
ncbi:hypothetical protein ACFO4O_16465 [Glaciecola siphonariae]|uniref:Uncharacterized protein n=1 Tax=Glaciecola siphonariae TaxID=521012 RepID=A0ABV9LYY5_9ALTE